MVNSKLVQLLKSLSAAEFRQFNKFIRSSFFTNSELVLKLYEYLRKHYPDFDSPKLTRERVYSHLFPKSPFNAAKLRDFSFKLTKILEDYLIYLEMNQDDFQKKKLLTHIYGKRNLNVIFKQKTTELLSHLDAQPARDATYYFEKYLLQQAYYFHPSTSRDGNIHQTVNEAFKNLNYFFSIERLSIGMELKTREKIFTEAFEPFDYAEYSFFPPKENEIYSLIKQVIELIETQNPKVYLALVPLFEQNIDKLGIVDQQRIIFSLINFTLSQIANQGVYYVEESFKLYELGLSKNIFFDEQHILPSVTFLNISLTGASLKKFAQTEAFINEYAAFLIEKDKNTIKTFAQAILYFYKGQFSKTIQLITQLPPFEPLLEINARLIVVRSYYELYLVDTTYYTAFDSYFKNYEKYLSRQSKLYTHKIKSYHNFMSLFKKLIKIKTTKSVSLDSINQLQNKLDTTLVVTARPWIQEKIAALRV